AVGVTGHLLGRDASYRGEYRQADLSVTYRRWLMPHLWVAGGPGVAMHRLGDAAYGVTGVGALAYELPVLLLDHVTLDLRVDGGVAAVTGERYAWFVGGVGLSFYASSTVAPRASDALDPYVYPELDE